jgi:membrane protease YdiL (CAAX protease family)
MTKWRRKFELIGLIVLGIAPAEVNWYFNPRLADSPRLFWTVDVLRFAILPAAIVAWGIFRGLFTAADLGLHGRIFGRKNAALLFAVMIAVTLFLCRLDTSLLEWALHAYPPNPGAAPAFSYKQMVPPPGPDTGLYRLLAVFYLAIGAAFSEEILFRGLLRRVFGSGLIGTIFFIVISAALFASVHLYGGPTKLAYALGHGIAFAAIYVITGNLWPLITAHAIIDLYWFSVA